MYPCSIFSIRHCSFTNMSAALPSYPPSICPAKIATIYRLCSLLGWVYNGDMMGIIDYVHCCMGNDYKWRVSNHNQWIWTMKMISMYHQFRRFSSYLNDSSFSPKLPFRWRSWWVSLPCRRSATAIDGAAAGACSAKCLRRPAAGARARANLGKGRGPNLFLRENDGKWRNMMGKW